MTVFLQSPTGAEKVRQCGYLNHLLFWPLYPDLYLCIPSAALRNRPQPDVFMAAFSPTVLARLLYGYLRKQ